MNNTNKPNSEEVNIKHLNKTKRKSKKKKATIPAVVLYKAVTGKVAAKININYGKICSDTTF